MVLGYIRYCLCERTNVLLRCRAVWVQVAAVAFALVDWGELGKEAVEIMTRATTETAQETSNASGGKIRRSRSCGAFDLRLLACATPTAKSTASAARAGWRTHQA